MTQQEHTYIAIDLKSFYASAECMDRGLDPLTTNLVVADASRTQKTICLAVSPSLKACGIPGRPRLFEVVQRMKEVNRARERKLQEIERDRLPQGIERNRLPQEIERNRLPQEIERNRLPQGMERDRLPQGKRLSEKDEEEKPADIPQTGAQLLMKMEAERPGAARNSSASLFRGRSVSAPELEADLSLEADYIIAVPRMAHYIEYSTRIYEIYLRYIAPEDIHVYSIDEVLMDATKYLELYKKSAHELAMEMIRAVLKETGITATAGIGPNLYLCKIAMDIEAKHTAPDADGVRIAELDEMSYRRKLWSHRPITDFWRVGRGTAKKLARYGMFTMGDVARYSLKDEDLLYKLFGVNAELLIDHAWGWEPCTIDLIKAYKPQNRSFSAGQVLQSAYDYEKARIVVHEMADGAALDLVEKGLVTDQMVLTVLYDNENLTNPVIREKYKGPVKEDRYGRQAPKPAHGTANLGKYTSSSRLITDAVLGLYDRIVNPDLLIRKIYIETNHVIEDSEHRPGRGDISGSEDGFLPKGDFGSKGGFGSGGSLGPGDTSGSGGSFDSGDTSDAGTWQQLDLFTDYEALEEEKEREKAALDKERRLQEAMLSIRRKYGKNAILKGTSLQEGATMRERNQSIGGHKA